MCFTEAPLGQGLVIQSYPHCVYPRVRGRGNYMIGDSSNGWCVVQKVNGSNKCLPRSVCCHRSFCLPLDACALSSSTCLTVYSSYSHSSFNSFCPVLVPVGSISYSPWTCERPFLHQRLNWFTHTVLPPTRHPNVSPQA